MDKYCVSYTGLVSGCPAAANDGNKHGDTESYVRRHRGAQRKTGKQMQRDGYIENNNNENDDNCNKVAYLISDVERQLTEMEKDDRTDRQ